MELLSLLKYLLPEYLVSYFDIVQAKTKDPKDEESPLSIYFEEKNLVPTEYVASDYHSKGFMAEIVIEDFPLRGRPVRLHIKRRRWTHKTTEQIIQRDWTLVAKGTRLTADFANFLKEISR